MQAVMNLPNYSMQHINELFDKPVQSVAAGSRDASRGSTFAKHAKNRSDPQNLGMTVQWKYSAPTLTKN